MRLAGVFSLALAAAAQVLTLQDGTPVRLRLDRTVSSANAHMGETVDFEVTEAVINQNYVVIPKGAVALGRVTKVETKRHAARSGGSRCLPQRKPLVYGLADEEIASRHGRRPALRRRIRIEQPTSRCAVRLGKCSVHALGFPNHSSFDVQEVSPLCQHR
jgi:hypothetical protein